jgi:hypothetical protein
MLLVAFSWAVVLSYLIRISLTAQFSDIGLENWIDGLGIGDLGII